jgi:hypothetical protein
MIILLPFQVFAHKKAGADRCFSDTAAPYQTAIWSSAMTAETLLPASRLRNLLRYDPETGSMVWLIRGPDEDARAGRRAAFNKKFAWKEAFTANSCGYRVGRIFDRMYKMHRVAWAIHYGAWPEGNIDHINGDKSDNRIQNLRLVDHVENARNTKTHAHNTSGHRGIHWYKAYGKWSAQIQVKGRNISLGYFGQKQDAIAARLAAESKYGFHENNGRLH